MMPLHFRGTCRRSYCSEPNCRAKPLPIGRYWRSCGRLPPMNRCRLSPKQIEFGFDYFHADEPRPREIVEVSDYAGQRELVVNCTQLGDSFTPSYDTPKKRKRVVADWCDFLANHPEALTSLRKQEERGQAVLPTGQADGTRAGRANRQCHRRCHRGPQGTWAWIPGVGLCLPTATP